MSEYSVEMQYFKLFFKNIFYATSYISNFRTNLAYLVTHQNRYWQQIHVRKNVRKNNDHLLSQGPVDQYSGVKW